MTECPVCEASSETCYRCSECGADLVDRGTEGREDVMADGGLEAAATHELVMTALEEQDDQEAADGIETSAIVEWVVDHSDVSEADVHDTIQWLEKQGEIYKPAAEHYRRTTPGESRWAP